MRSDRLCPVLTMELLQFYYSRFTAQPCRVMSTHAMWSRSANTGASIGDLFFRLKGKFGNGIVDPVVSDMGIFQ